MKVSYQLTSLDDEHIAADENGSAAGTPCSLPYWRLLFDSAVLCTGAYIAWNQGSLGIVLVALLVLAVRVWHDRYVLLIWPVIGSEYSTSDPGETIEVEVDGFGIKAQLDGATFSVPWSSIRRILRTTHGFYFYYGAGVVFLPARCLSSQVLVEVDSVVNTSAAADKIVVRGSPKIDRV